MRGANICTKSHEYYIFYTILFTLLKASTVDGGEEQKSSAILKIKRVHQ